MVNIKYYAVCQKNFAAKKVCCNSTVTFCVGTNYYDKNEKCLFFPEKKCYYTYICGKLTTYNKLDFDIMMNKSTIDFI